MEISANYKLDEFTQSATAKRLKIDNTPDNSVVNNIISLVQNVMQPLSDNYRGTIIITSGYRCEELNTAVKGSRTSQHMKGEACDFVCADKAKAFNFIKNNLEFDQLIWEKGDDEQPQWVHVSFCKKNRKEVKCFK